MKHEPWVRCFQMHMFWWCTGPQITAQQWRLQNEESKNGSREGKKRPTIDVIFTFISCARDQRTCHTRKYSFDLNLLDFRYRSCIKIRFYFCCCCCYYSMPLLPFPLIVCHFPLPRHFSMGKTAAKFYKRKRIPERFEYCFVVRLYFA